MNMVNSGGAEQVLIEQLKARIEELEKIDTAQQARIWELESGMHMLADAIQRGDEIEFIPEKKT